MVQKINKIKNSLLKNVFWNKTVGVWMSFSIQWSKEVEGEGGGSMGAKIESGKYEVTSWNKFLHGK